MCTTPSSVCTWKYRAPAHPRSSGRSKPTTLATTTTGRGGGVTDDYHFYNEHISGKELFTFPAHASVGAKVKFIRFIIRSSASQSYTIPSGTIVTLGINPNQGSLDSS